MTDSATFRATIPGIMSALKVSGDGGARLQLDIPESDLLDALPLLAWRDKVLLVTVAPEPNKQSIGEQSGRAGQSQLDKGSKRQSGWQAPQEQGAN